METLEDLKERFERLKERLTDEWKDRGISIPPTDKEVWGQMRAIAVQHKEEAFADDMEGYVQTYQERIKIIDEILKSLE